MGEALRLLVVRAVAAGVPSEKGEMYEGARG